MEDLFTSNPTLAKEAWIRMRGWYHDAEDILSLIDSEDREDELREGGPLLESSPFPWDGANQLL